MYFLNSYGYNENMDVHRIEGIKYNFNRLSDDELESIRDHLIEDHQRITAEIAELDQAIFERNHQQIPLNVGIIALNQDSQPQ